MEMTRKKQSKKIESLILRMDQLEAILPGKIDEAIQERSDYIFKRMQLMFDKVIQIFTPEQAREFSKYIDGLNEAKK